MWFAFSTVVYIKMFIIFDDTHTLLTVLSLSVSMYANIQKFEKKTEYFKQGINEKWQLIHLHLYKVFFSSTNPEFFLSQFIKKK